MEKEKNQSNRNITNLNLISDYKSFEELCVLSFGEGTNQDYSMNKWFFDDNPYNPNSKNLMYVLKEENKIIGTDGLTPFELYINGKTYLAAHSVKSMTHPDYKRQGIFRMMTNNSVEKGKENGVDLIIGLANKNSYPAYEKFGWPTLYEKEAYVRPINIENKLKGKVKFGLISSVGSSIYNSFDRCRLKSKNLIEKYSVNVISKNCVTESLGKYWDKYKEKYDVCIVRDYKYLNYRYNMRPDVSYTILEAKTKNENIGYVILRVTKANGSTLVSVAENFTDPTNADYIGILVEMIINYSYEILAEYVVIGTGLYGKYKTVLANYGFSVTKKPLLNNMMIAKIINADIKLEDIAGHDKWHISQGDGETEIDI